MRITVAISGASGAIYAKALIERLCQNKNVDSISLVLSSNAIGVVEYETDNQWINNLDGKVKTYQNNDFYTPIASGSNCDDVMIIVPCSAGIMGRIASGVSDSLITRAADVILKERKKLILVLRETPYSLIHIENMRTITLSGGIILPATPSFYRETSSIESIVLSVVERIEQLIPLDTQRYKWQE